MQGLVNDRASYIGHNKKSPLIIILHLMVKTLLIIIQQAINQPELNLIPNDLTLSQRLIPRYYRNLRQATVGPQVDNRGVKERQYQDLDDHWR